MNTSSGMKTIIMFIYIYINCDAFQLGQTVAKICSSSLVPRQTELSG